MEFYHLQEKSCTRVRRVLPLTQTRMAIMRSLLQSSSEQTERIHSHGKERKYYVR